MKSKGKLIFIFLIAAVILILMIIRTAGNRTWKRTADQAAEMVASGECFMDISAMNGITEPILLLRLGNALPDSLILPTGFPWRQITFSDLTEKETLNDLMIREGRLVIVPGSREDGIKAWILLNQLGMENIYVLTGRMGEGEVLKYQFRPDSAFRPEPEQPEN